MISISRLLARQFRAVARRAGLSKRHGNYVRLIATPEALSVFAANTRVAVEYRDGGRFVADDLTVPLQLFADCEAKKSDLVTIRSGEPGHIIATWEEGGVPQQRDYLIADEASIPTVPPSPDRFASNGPELVIALRDVMETTDHNSTRYALSCVQLQERGSLTATDGHQLLRQSGFVFGWDGDILIEASDVFSSRELSHDQAVQIGRTDDWVTMQLGSWTIHHAIRHAGRFPDVDRVILVAEAIVTRMQLDEADAEFLADRIERLPADDTPDRPVTVDLNGSVAIRARQDQTSPLTELLLSRSRRIGPEIRLHTNREFLARAIDLGFTEFGFVGGEAPCVCIDAHRTYVWQLLSPDHALPPSDQVQRITSPAAAASVRSSMTTPRVLSRPQSLSSKDQRMRSNNRGSSPVNRLPVSAETTTTPAASASDLINQAEQVRESLRNTLTHVSTLITVAKQQRRQSRLMKSTLASLKQWQQLEA